MGAGLHAIVALGASIEKQRLVDGAGRTQPILTEGRRRLLRRRIFVLGKFVSRLRNREDRILEKVAPAVFGVVSH